MTVDPAGGTAPPSPQRPAILVTVAGRLDTIVNPATGSVYPNMSLASSIIMAGVAKGYAVALLSLCGFGEMGSSGTYGKQNSNPMGKYVHGKQNLH